MKNDQILNIFLILILFSACKDTNSNGSAKTNPITEDTLKAVKLEEGRSTATTIYVWVDRLRLRREANTSSDVIIELKEGTQLIYRGEKTDFTQKIQLRGQVYEEPWLKVETDKGETGWVFGGAVKFYKPKIDQVKIAL